MARKKAALILSLAIACSLAVTGCGNNESDKIQENDKPVKVVDSEKDKVDNVSPVDNAENVEGNGDKADVKETINESSNLKYISASKLNVRSKPEKNASIIKGLLKGTRIEVLDMIVDETNSMTWYKVSVGDQEGYLSAAYTVDDRMELLSEAYRSLDYTKIEKKEYASNPRVDAKGIYVTANSAASTSRLDKLIKLAKETDINAFVIDVKNDSGHILFESEVANKINPGANSIVYIKDMKSFMKKLKDNDIYAIGRIVSFKDPIYAKRYPERTITYKNDPNKAFTKRDNLPWLSAYVRDIWEYNLGIAKEAAEYGFNEIQFDYVRFPASNGGKLDSVLDYKNKENESKPQAIQNYLKYAREQLAPLETYLSADVYGLVGSVHDDMGLGQYWEAIANVVDYISPMMYPSHYGTGVYGLKVPDANPYRTIEVGIQDALGRNENLDEASLIRPWIQDFTATWVPGHISYKDAEVKAQVKALKDNGVDSYLLWSPSNRYHTGQLK